MLAVVALAVAAPELFSGQPPAPAESPGPQSAPVLQPGLRRAASRPTDPAAPETVTEPPSPGPSADPYAAVIRPSEEAAALLGRANEGIRRQDWKLAVDSLQRIMDLAGAHLLTDDDLLFESARRFARRRVATLPPEGLAAYRLLHDDEAAALFERAVTDHDEALLRSITDRLLPTRVGARAAATLADWWIDEGRFHEAAALLVFLKNHYPDSDLPRWVVPARLAVCLAALGRPEAAEEMFAAAGETPPSLREAWSGYVRSAAAASAPAAADEWPMAGGSPARNGRMPAVEPTLLAGLPWRVPLSALAPPIDAPMVREYARRRGLGPVASVTATSRIVAVRAGRAVLGLDPESFEPLWRCIPGEGRGGLVELEDRGRGTSPPRDAPVSVQIEALHGQPEVRRLLFDSVAAQLTQAGDLVLAVQWPEDPPLIWPVWEARDAPGGKVPAAPFTPNAVVALSAADGSTVWVSDTFAGDDAPGAVQFMGAPVPVGDELLAVGRLDNDLHAVFLDRATGRCRRHVHLCGIGGAPFESLTALPACVADGVAYLPTGRGLLLAMDVAEGSVLWASRYADHAEQPPRVGWLPSSPVVGGDTIWLAPTDAHLLVGFDRFSGRPRVRVPRGRCTHIIAVDAGRVWLGGGEAAAVDPATGEVIWRRSVGDPSGRGILSGGRLFLPTWDGLVILDAGTGEPLGGTDPVQGAAPGNLLAWRGSLYDAALLEVSRYPDLKQGYQEAVRAHAEAPADASRALRLAWLERLEGRHRRALEVLAGLPDSLEREDPRRFAQAAHLKVLCLLDEAAGTDDGEAALRQVEQASAAARSPEDVILSALTAGDLERRLGRPLVACRRYLTLITDPAGDGMIEVEEGLRQTARLAAAQRLADIQELLPPAQRAAPVVARIRDAIGAADEAVLLRRLAEGVVKGPAAGRAELAAAVQARNELQYEQAEALLSEALRKAEDPQVRAEARARLAALHLEPDDLSVSAAASRLLDELTAEGDAPVPADVLEEHWLPWSAAAEEQIARIPARQAASALRQRLSSSPSAAGRAGGLPPATPPAGPRVTVHPGEALLSLRTAGCACLEDMVLTLRDGRTVTAYRFDSGELLWSADMRLLNELAVSTRTPAMLRRISGGPGEAEPAPGLFAVTDGWTLAAHTACGLHGVGLPTGRRLWSRPFAPGPDCGPEGSGSDACIWAGEGTVLSLDAAGIAEAAPVHDGSRVRWRRQLPDAAWWTVRSRGGYTIAVTAGLDRVEVLDTRTGARRGTCRLVQPPGEARLINLALFDGLVCGPAGERVVAAYDLGAPGIERWRVEMPGELVQLFKPADDRLAVADRDGRISLHAAADGRRLMTARTSACGDGVIDGAVVDGVLYVYGYAHRPENPRRGADRHSAFGLAAIRIADGQVLWQTEGIGPQTWLSADLFRQPSDVVVLASVAAPGVAPPGPGSDAREAPPVPGVVVRMLERRTGRPVGEAVRLNVPASAQAGAVSGVQVRGGTLLVVAGEAHFRIPLAGVSP